MKTLNFHPYYAEYLRAKTKTTTLRLTNRGRYRSGETVMLTLGWDERKATPLHTVIIKKVYSKPIGRLSAGDLRGESPDCHDAETARLVLGNVYRKVLRATDRVTIIKFEHKIGGASCRSD